MNNQLLIRIKFITHTSDGITSNIAKLAGVLWKIIFFSFASTVIQLECDVFCFCLVVGASALAIPFAII